MPKMKTKRAVAKRFKLTASGKLKRKSANLRHILEKKSQSRKRAARKTEYVHSSDAARIKRCLPYGS